MEKSNKYSTFNNSGSDVPENFSMESHIMETLESKIRERSQKQWMECCWQQDNGIELLRRLNLMAG